MQKGAFGQRAIRKHCLKTGVNLRYIASKMLAIHKVFLRFFPYLTQIPTIFRCFAVLKWRLFSLTYNKITGILMYLGDFLFS